jgi:signal transduction histidine kinase
MLGYNNLSMFYIHNGKEDSGFYFVKQAYDMAEKEKFYPDRNDIAINLADEYTFRRQYRNCLQLLDKIYADTAQIPLLPQKLHLSLLIRYDALKGLGRLLEATDVLEQYNFLGERIYQDNARQKAQETDEKLKRSEQAQKLAQIRLVAKKKNLWLGLLVMGITSAAFFIGYQRKKQQVHRQQFVTLQKEKELAVVKAKLTGQVKERERVSKEIHDDIGSSLTTLGLLSDMLRKEPGYADNPNVQKISSVTQDIVNSMNEIIWAVNTQNDTAGSLLAHIRKFATNFLQQHHILFEYDENIEQKDYPLDNIARRNIYLTVKEAIHNVVKHSGAREVHLEAMLDETILKLVVTDDGKGFNPATIASGGQGLMNMKERIDEIGGNWYVETGSGNTQVYIVYPLDATNHRSNRSS